MKWRIHYARSTGLMPFSSEDGDPRDAPRWGVLAIPYEDPLTGFTVASGKDFFVHQDDRWKSVDQIGMRDHCVLVREPLVLFGITVTDDEFEQVMRQACDDFGPKSARRVWER